jgi:serine/threonine protein kinase
MSTEFHDRVRQILERAVRLEANSRESFIRQACAGDPELLREVCSLLPHYNTVHDFEPRRPRGSAWKLPGTTAFAAAGEEIADAELPDPELTPPFSIDQYTVFEVLGRGGMGVVYRAVDPARRRQVAIKVLQKRLLSREHRSRFTFEAEILRQLRHPGIARILHAGVAPIEQRETVPGERDPLPYFVMEYIRGTSLTAFAEANRLSARGRLSLLAKVCQAVQYAHHRGIVHRDLKPDNILVERSGQPKILDFGIAHILAFQSSLLRDEEGCFAGTLDYASPEQLAGSITDLTPRSDVYTLGLIAHELLTGRLPRREGAGLRLNLRGVRFDDDSSRQIPNRGELNRALAAILATALRGTKGPTYDSAGEFGADVESLLARCAPRSGWSGFKSRLAGFVTSRSKGSCEPANRPLSAVLRQRIALAMESEGYRSGATGEATNTDSIESPSGVGDQEDDVEP